MSEPSLFERAGRAMDDRKRAVFDCEVGVSTDGSSVLRLLTSDFDVDIEEVESVIFPVLDQLIVLLATAGGGPVELARSAWSDGFTIGLTLGRLHERERVAEAKSLDGRRES